MIWNSEDCNHDKTYDITLGLGDPIITIMSFINGLRYSLGENKEKEFFFG
jgi:hypothetical protein